MIPCNQTHFSICFTLGHQEDPPDQLVLNILLKRNTRELRLSPLLSSSLCRLEWSVGAGGQSLAVSVMIQVAAATLSSSLADTWWKTYLFALLPLTSLVFVSLLLHFSPRPSFSNNSFFSLNPTFQISCIVSALLGYHTEQDEKPGKQLISCANWQGRGVVVCVLCMLGKKAWCKRLCVYVCVSVCSRHSMSS